ncbi:MAG: ABC transporter substrate-binding protein [Treponema sp.]|jgi:iron complex transport system substrate-binding protein|nr:ABC transporter substrate-binding protein [Treponema sp.]
MAYSRFVALPLLCLLAAACDSKNVGAVTPASITASATAETKQTPAPVAAPYWSLVREAGVDYVADKQGNRVPSAEYRRIVVISPGAVETCYLIGAEGAIAAIPESREGIWPTEQTALLPTIGNAARPDLESIIALEPDLILGSAMNGALVSDLATRGYPVLIHGADTMEDIFATTLLIGTLTGTRAAAEALVAEKKQALVALAESLGTNAAPLKGAFLYSVNPIMAFTEDSLPGEILTLLGAHNIAAGLPVEQPILSSEYLLTENPDFLFGAMSITKPEDILGADSVIQKTRAGQTGAISIVPSSLFLRPSPRLVDSLRALQETLSALRQPVTEGL